MYVSNERLAQIKVCCDYATMYNQMAMVSTEEVSNMARELLDWRERYMDQELQRYAEIEAAE